MDSLVIAIASHLVNKKGLAVLILPHSGSVKCYTSTVHGRFMDTVVSVIIVCGLLNVIPWLLLLYFRPDLKINDQVQTIDEGLAMVAKALFERFENLEDLASSLAPAVAENPLQSIISAFLQSRLEGNDLYGRNSDGTFNGTREIQEIKSSQEVEEP